MNNALNEISTIDNGWDYSDLSTLSSIHGGPEQLIEDIYSDGYRDGFCDGYPTGYDDGHNDGVSSVLQVVIPLALAALVGLGTWGYRMWQNRKKNTEEVRILAEEVSKLKAATYICELSQEYEQDADLNEDENISCLTSI
jgi:hypothetical protein